MPRTTPSRANDSDVSSHAAEPLELDPGRWTFCPDCLTVYDDYEKAVNEMAE